MSAVNTGPQIVKNSLILNLDAGNNRSYPTNRFQSVGSGLVTESVNFVYQGTTGFQRIAAGTVIGGYTVKASDVVYSYALGGTGCHYHGNPAVIPAGVYATFSFDYLVTGATNYPTTNYLANFENYGGGALGGSVGVANSLQNVWQRATFTSGPTSSAGTQAMFLYPGACGGKLADNGTVYYRNPKVEWTNVDTGNGNFSSTSNITIWKDLSGNNYHGTLTNGPTSNVSNLGSVLFDGVDDYVALPTSGLAFGAGQFTIEAWVYLTSNAVTYNGVYYSQSSNVSGFIGFGYTSGTGFLLSDYNGSVRVTTTNTTSISINTWYHVVGLRNGSNQYIVYVNGVASTTNNTSTLSLTTLDPRIGINPASSAERWTGRIATVKMYNRALTQTEISQNYEATKTRFGL